MGALIEKVNPDANLVAVVEDDGRTIYLYVRGVGIDVGLRSTWVRNRVAAPAGIDRDGMEQGFAPRMPARHCRHPAGEGELEVDSLRLVWLPEGDGVALFEGAALLAVLPAWSGVGGFDGYARDAIGEGPHAWELSADSVLHARFAEADGYWASWEHDGGPWQAARQGQLAAYEAVLGAHSKYFAIDGDYWPPKALVQFELERAVVLATVGVALRPMPAVERVVEDPAHLRRIELGAVLPGRPSEATLRAVAIELSSLATLPWARFTWLGHGHTVASTAFADAGFAGCVLVGDGSLGPGVALPALFGDPVRVLWLVPLTDLELQRAKRDGSQAIISGLTYPRS